MSSSVSEDQDQRSNGGLEDLTTMTIESLRARLLSERAISRTAKQRADELAKRVIELEDQLKMVSLQRRRAEKATADVLAILESNGISDASDDFDSNSEGETTISDSKVSSHTSKKKGASTDFEVRRRDIDTYSSSEIDSSPSTGRSLSWKSGKDSSNYLERKKFMDPGRRRSSSFTSNSSLPKRVGKSCRRIRRKETRSLAEELQKDPKMDDDHDVRVTTHSQDLPNCADIGSQNLKDDPRNYEVENPCKVPAAGFSGTGVTETKVSSRNDQNKPMERPPRDQAEDETDRKAQREWEEKFRENSNSVLDSCDPGNRSDVTEERYEMKAEHACSTGRINYSNQETELQVTNTGSTEDPNHGLVSQPVNPRYSQDPKTSSMVAHEPLSEFGFPMSNGNGNMYLEDSNRRPSSSSYMHFPASGSRGEPLGNAPISSANNGENSDSRKELALIPQKSSSNLKTVLEALQQAKLSLKGKIYDMPAPEVGYSGKRMEPFVPAARTLDGMEIPVGCPGIFRLPTDFQFERTTFANHLQPDSVPSLPNHSPGNALTKLSSPYVDPRSNVFVGDRFYTSSSPSFMEMRSGIHMGTSPYTQRVPEIHTSAMPLTEVRSSIPNRTPLFEPALDATVSSRSTYLDPRLSPGLPPSSNYTYPTYPIYPDMRPQLQTSERFSRSSSMEFGMPSAARFTLYDNHKRPNVYK